MFIRLLGKGTLFLGLLLMGTVRAGAQQVELTLHDADSLFTARNLELLAARCDVSKAEAAVAQARLYANPVISVEENVYNRLNGRYFDFGKRSEQVLGVDQLISIAGQHANAVRAARADRDVAVSRFEDLLRTLRGELHKTFVQLYFAQRRMNLYQSEIVSLRQTLDALVIQVKKGNISQIEAARIQALLLSLRKEQDQYSADVSELEGRLRVLLSMAPGVKPRALFSPECIASMPDPDSFSLDIEGSLSGRPDVQMAKNMQASADANLRLERSKAYPEIHITGQYDRNAGYFPNYFAIGATVSVPLFNRNQGNIRSARAAVEQSRSQFDGIKEQAANDIEVAAENFRRSLRLERAVADDYDKTDIKNLFESVNENYRKRNISLLEFVDYYSTYKNAMLELSSVRENVFLAAEQLNTAAGRTVIKY